MFHARPVLVGFLVMVLAAEAHALITSRTFTVTGRYSHFVNVSGTPIETVLDEQVRSFDGAGFASATVEAPLGSFFDVDYAGPAFAEAAARVIDVGADGYFVTTNAFVTGQIVSTPLEPNNPVMTSLVEDVAFGAAPVGDGIRVLYSFDLKNLSTEVWDNRFMAGPTGRGGVELSYSVRFNDVLKYLTFAFMVGDQDGYELTLGGVPGVDFRGDPVSSLLDIRSETTGMGVVPHVVEFEDMAVRFLDLGLAAGGESYEVKATLTARLSLPEFDYEVGGRGNIGDPNDITGVGLGQITLAPVPELSMAWLFLAGGGLLAFLRRRAR